MKTVCLIPAIAFLSLFLAAGPVFSNQLTPLQKAWLYRVVMRSPVLENNLGVHFIFRTGKPLKMQNNSHVIDYDSIEQCIVLNSDLLYIDYEKLRNQSPGLIAEASTKLALWELYNCLNVGNGVIDGKKQDSVYTFFYSAILNVLPDKLQKNKKSQQLIIQLLEPSARMENKIQILAQTKQLTLNEQKQVLEKWNTLVRDFVKRRSRYYFSILYGDPEYFKEILIAAGEGSGSAGLLNEYEVADDLNRRGNGKGVGLFTYEFIRGQGKIVLHTKPEINTEKIMNMPTLVHFSIWGMNLTVKPTIVVNTDNKTYLFYANYETKDISPDPSLGNGKNYHDLTEEFRIMKIQKKKEELFGENGLDLLLYKEHARRDTILSMITKKEEEIDSLDPANPKYTEIVEYKRKLIEDYKSSLESKRLRIFELEKRYETLNLEIIQLEEEYNKMISKLGNNVQSWKIQDSLYLFNDGAWFNYKTQDFVIPPNNKEGKIDIKLLATGINITAKKIDEVQLYVNITNGKLLATKEKPVCLPVFKKEVFYDPDEFKKNMEINDEEQKLIKYYKEKIAENPGNIKINLLACGNFTDDNVCQSLSHLGNIKNYPETNSKNQPMFANARKSVVELRHYNDTIYITIKSFTDPVNTKLSKLSVSDLTLLNKYFHVTQGYNPYLSALRTFNAYSNISKSLTGLNDAEIYVELGNNRVTFSDVQPYLTAR